MVNDFFRIYRHVLIRVMSIAIRRVSFSSKSRLDTPAGTLDHIPSSSLELSSSSSSSSSTTGLGLAGLLGLVGKSLGLTPSDLSLSHSNFQASVALSCSSLISFHSASHCSLAALLDFRTSPLSHS